MDLELKYKTLKERREQIETSRKDYLAQIKVYESQLAELDKDLRAKGVDPAKLEEIVAAMKLDVEKKMTEFEAQLNDSEGQLAKIVAKFEEASKQ